MNIKEHQAETANTSSNNISKTLRRSGSAPSMFHFANDNKEAHDEEQTDTSEQFYTTASTTNDASSYMAVDVPLGNGDNKETPFDEDKKMKQQEQPTEKTNNSASFGRGIVADFKRTILTHWKEEMTNFNLKTVAVSFFLFFACIAPAITFGAIYEKATENWIGATEMITATAWCGIVYSLIGGQPMMINGGTGPVLAFTEIIYKMSESMGVPFLTFNAWIGLWVCLYMLVAAFLDLNRIIKHATRFTDEIFSLLISVIFIINALGSPFAPVGIYYYFEEDHASHELHQDKEVEHYSYMATAFLSLLVCLGTVQLAFSLRRAKFAPYMYNQMARNIVTDFAVVIAIVIMALVANILFPEVELESLNVPESFAPTFACCTAECQTNWPEDCPDLADPYKQRPWLVDLFDLNGKNYVPFVAAGPAVLAFILVFLDDGITWHLINHPSHKLEHGSAFNYDTVVVGAMIAVNSMIGLPWLVAATVRSLNHLNAMAEKSPEGKILSVQETRLTNLGIHLFCLVSIFALNLLKVIPVPVLYGVFLFMGLVSLGTNQFWSRVTMLFMEPGRYPKEPFTEFMKTKRIHMFTLIQLFLFVLLYAVKAIKKIAIAFPLIIACCIPIRLYLLPKIFTKEELILIDGDDEAIMLWLKEIAATSRATPQNSSSDDRGDNEDDEALQMPSTIGGDSVMVPTEAEASVTTHSLGMNEDIDVDEYQEHMDNERHDLVPPLPSETGALPMTSTSAQARRKPRTKRQKSVSCPSGALFAVPPPVVLEQHASSEADSSTVDSEENAAEAAAPLLRRRRVKSLSCPTHQLFAEAERHIASNYFFG